MWIGTTSDSADQMAGISIVASRPQVAAGFFFLDGEE
jgi:hypothetical protein